MRLGGSNFSAGFNFYSNPTDRAVENDTSERPFTISGHAQLVRKKVSGEKVLEIVAEKRS